VIDPIELNDDGMRETQRGETKRGRAPFVCLNNPELIARVAFEKSRRRTIADTNFRRFHNCFEEQAA